MNPQRNLSWPHKYNFLKMTRKKTRSLKFSFMWSWRVTLWVHQGNMYVHYRNTVINTSKINKTHMLNCYRQEWSKAARAFRNEHPVSLVLLHLYTLCCKHVMGTRELVNSAVSVLVKSTGVQCIPVLPRTKKSWKNMAYQVLDPGFTMHAWDAARDSTCMHARMSWPAVSKELLAAKYARVAPRCQTAWPLCWPQIALRQRRSSWLLFKPEGALEVPRLTPALLRCF
jgi:hypothetical protein